MKLQLLTLTLALGVGAPAFAGDGQATIDELAARAGITPREVAMVVGAHTAYAEYRTSYSRARAKLNRALDGVPLEEFLAARAAQNEPVAQVESTPAVAQNEG